MSTSATALLLALGLLCLLAIVALAVGLGALAAHLLGRMAGE
jgi:hypothetical protein